ncbi:MAG: metal-dependent hydrolase [Euryarchaeota archaeon]|nr:metal-dependent hydrolase [Euryarchaeota archaeon]
MRKAASFSLLATLPDADVLFHVHRSMSHSLVFILMVCIPVIIVTYKFYKTWFIDSIIATLAILSHLFMDLFTYYTPLFWPLFNKSIYVVAELTTNMNDVPDLHPNLNVYFEPTIFCQTADINAVIISSQGVAVSLVLLIGLILKHLSIRPSSS